MNKEKEEYLEKFSFTSCNECINKVNGIYQAECMYCRHYYPCLFEKKVKDEQ